MVLDSRHTKKGVAEIVLIDKPKGITSFDAIRILRRRYGVYKMGHAGTLDPLASGLLIIGINKGTKKLSQYLKLPKVYEADVFLGKRTATADMEGPVLDQRAVLSIEREQVEEVLNSLVGKITLHVPLYSAVKVSGTPLYKRARKGKNVSPPKRIMEIRWIRLKDLFPTEKYYILRIELEVQSGTYIRSIAEEIGRRLGYPAVIKDLRRTRIGDFRVEDAVQVL